MAVPSRNVSFKKPEEPAFLKAFKARVGYKEEATVDTKREVTQPVPEGEVDRDDERPTVVVLREGDVGEEEYHQYLQQQTELVSSDIMTSATEDVKKPQRHLSQSSEEDGDGGEKFVFKKPALKRRSSDSGKIEASSSTSPTSRKKPREDSTKSSSSSKNRTKRQKGVKNSSLLSFGDGDEEEDA